MKLSKRITGLNGGGSDGWGVYYRAKELIAQGKDILELTQGEHDIGTQEQILSAMHQDALAGHTGYPLLPGRTELRDMIARRVQQRTGVVTRRENVCIMPGGQAGLFASHCAVCDPGSRALFIDPYYATYPGTIRAAGGIPVPIQAKSRDGFKPDPVDIADCAAGAVSLLINSPNNPTGAVYSRQTMDGIVEVCIEHDLWLISDEVYDTQVWQGEHISPRTLPGMIERTLVIGSLSKSHAMTGSRIGWIVGPEEVVAEIINLTTNTTYGVPNYIQGAAIYALNQGCKLEETIAAPFRRRRALAKNLLIQHPTLKLIPADGAMYVMLDIRATGLSGEEFAFSLLDATDIAVMPGESFGRAAAGHIRIAMTVDDDRFQTALNQIVEFAEGLQI